MQKKNPAERDRRDTGESLERPSPIFECGRAARMIEILLKNGIVNTF
jgi:hypothetical protein